MEINELKALLDQFDQSSLTELHYETSSIKVGFSKNEAPPVGVSAPAVGSDFAVAATPAPTLNAEATPTNNPVTVATGTVVTSPLVGTFYLKPGPDEDNFIEVGQHVTAGQTVAIIEAMKVMNEIPAPVSGTVVSIFASAQGMVEFDQPLVEIQED